MFSVSARFRQPLITASLVMSSLFAMPSLAQQATAQDADLQKGRLYNEIDIQVQKDSARGTSFGTQNAYLIQKMNFNAAAWPETTMARYIVKEAPQTQLTKTTPGVTYKTLNDMTKSAQGHVDYKKSATLLQILSGMTDKPASMSQQIFIQLQTMADKLEAKYNPSHNRAWHDNIFKRAVITHHKLLQQPAKDYAAKHATGLKRITPALSVVPQHVKDVIPQLEVRNRTTTKGVANLTTEQIAGFYELVGHDAFDLLTAMQNGKGQMKLVDFYRQNPRYNKKPGRAESRTKAVLSKAFLHQYYNAGYDQADFPLDIQSRDYDVAFASFHGTHRLKIPIKPPITPVVVDKPVEIIKEVPVVKTDTVQKITSDSVGIERTPPHGYVRLGSEWINFEKFGPGIKDRDYGSLFTTYGARLDAVLQKDFIGNRYIDRNNKVYHKRGHVGFELSAMGAVGQARFDRRDANYAIPETQPLKTVDPFWSAGMGAAVRVGPVQGGAHLRYNRPRTSGLMDQAVVTYNVQANVLGLIGKQGGVHRVSVATEARDANLALNNRGDLPQRTPDYWTRSSTAQSLRYTYTRNKVAIEAEVGVQGTNPSRFSIDPGNYIKSMVTVSGDDKVFAGVGIRYVLGGKQKKTVVKSGYTLQADGTKTDAFADTTITHQPITPLERAIFTNYRRNTTLAKPQPAPQAIPPQDSTTTTAYKGVDFSPRLP